ncbi:motility associated factor glycosyltransferase family protein [Caldicellulosiruptor acetigenus]|uniref:motility associated factor glycosyltransferase family protein n=1 Tax=Caldicellulosiruptor acetigenus TaxID=301953 RepID=UPI000409BB0A|nr:6-hydroxymethylpterin diphosphokinase MptE-like protein [Caldicellulosiruptor acetigenus]WAM37251.1 DUF115 domain-containing protein [Caldicellulosiruptor acetigenus]
MEEIFKKNVQILRERFNIIFKMNQGYLKEKTLNLMRELTEYEKNVDSIEINQLKSNDIIVFIGFGTGNFIRRILKSLSEDSILIIIEPSYELLNEVFCSESFEDILTDDRVFLIIDNGSEKLINIIEEVIPWELSLRLKNLVHPFYKECFGAYIERIKNRLDEFRIIKETEIKTIFYSSHVIKKNMLANLIFIPESSLGNKLENYFKDIPAIIIGAGPSLDNNINELKKAKGKAILIAVGRVLKRLLQVGVIPDFVVSVDYSEKNYNFFKGINYSNIMLVYGMGINFNILKNHNGKKILMLTTADSCVNKLLAEMGYEYKLFKGGGSVSCFAYEFARVIGANPIILVGQDFAFTDNKVYSNISLHEGEKNEIREDELLWVESNDGRKVATNKIYFGFLKWFENEIEKDQEKIRVINVSERGAKIEGTIVMRLGTVIEEYCYKTINIEKYMNTISHEYLINKEIYIKLLNEVKNQLSELKLIGEIGISICNQFFEKVIREEKFHMANYFSDLLTDIENELLEKELAYTLVEELMIKENYIINNMDDSFLEPKEFLKSFYLKNKILYESIIKYSQYAGDLIHGLVDIK